MLHLLIVTVVLFFGQLCPRPGHPDQVCCTAAEMAKHMTGPIPDPNAGLWMGCNLDCNDVIDLRDVHIWQGGRGRVCW